MEERSVVEWCEGGWREGSGERERDGIRRERESKQEQDLEIDLQHNHKAFYHNIGKPRVDILNTLHFASGSK